MRRRRSGPGCAPCAPAARRRAPDRHPAATRSARAPRDPGTPRRARSPRSPESDRRRFAASACPTARRWGLRLPAADSRDRRPRGIAARCSCLKVREASLQTAYDIRIRALPRAERRQRPQPRQVVAIRKLLDQNPGQWRCRLPDRESRMPSALEQHHAQAEAAGDHRQHRPAETGADDGEVSVDASQAHVDGCRRHAARDS